MRDIQHITTELTEDFDYLEDWESRYSYIIDLGEQLPAYDKSLQIEAHRVHGCTSQVWLMAYDDGQYLQLSGTSDSTIVRGLMALLFKLYHNQPPANIIQHQPEEFFAALQLSKHISPSRSNGFYAMLQKIKYLAQQASQ